MATRSSYLLIACCICWLATSLTSANILKGFVTKEVPALEDIPNIASEFRRLSSRSEYTDEELDFHEKSERELKGSKSTSTSKSKSSSSSSGKEKGGNSGNGNGNRAENQYPEIPESPPEFNEIGELSFIILMDEFDYNTQPIALGTRFAFTGRLATDEFHVGQASGTCTIGSDISTNFAICTIYMTFKSEGAFGYGTISVTGNTDEVGGYLSVTGASGDLANTNEGSARVMFDPAGNPIIYVLIQLHSSA